MLGIVTNFVIECTSDLTSISSVVRVTDVFSSYDEVEDDEWGRDTHEDGCAVAAVCWLFLLVIFRSVLSALECYTNNV